MERENKNFQELLEKWKLSYNEQFLEDKRRCL